MRVTVGTIIGLIASKHSHNDILDMYPYLTHDDIFAALAYTKDFDACK